VSFTCPSTSEVEYLAYAEALNNLDRKREYCKFYGKKFADSYYYCPYYNKPPEKVEFWKKLLKEMYCKSENFVHYGFYPCRPSGTGIGPVVGLIVAAIIVLIIIVVVCIRCYYKSLKISNTSKDGSSS
jgi:hypothetical protein